jgi:hypothetical protein
MSELNWNRRQCTKVCGWLSKHKPEQSKLIAEWCPNGNAEIRLYATATSIKPQLYINFCGVLDLIIDTPRKVGNRRCWCKSMLYDTIKEWYLNG